MGRRLLLILGLALLATACGGGTTLLSGQEVLSAIPWSGPETARYRLLQGKDLKGHGELRLELQGDVLSLAQTFEFPDQKLTDDVSALVDPATLRPTRVERTISGPEGERHCRADYAAGTAVVEQKAKKETRTDRLGVPPRSYDSWSDLFLWRTISFSESFQVTYADVLSCTLTKPQVLSVALRVKGRETVSVPAGTFEAWRLEIRSGGRTQKAWYADDAARTLVRYDNEDLVFELESRE
ncbi:MAG TPA: DUF3108 domain-containing protein [Dehalococcoidia bacterium]|nr:DUF3108 domain-containing protein [Dehalococcoidia bacterium]